MGFIKFFVKEDYCRDAVVRIPLKRKLKWGNILGVGIASLATIATFFIANKQETPQKNNTSYEQRIPTSQDPNSQYDHRIVGDFGEIDRKWVPKAKIEQVDSGGKVIAKLNSDERWDDDNNNNNNNNQSPIQINDDSSRIKENSRISDLFDQKKQASLEEKNTYDSAKPLPASFSKTPPVFDSKVEFKPNTSSKDELTKITNPTTSETKSRYLLREDKLAKAGWKNEKGKYIGNGRIEGDQVVYNIGHGSDNNVYGITFIGRDSNRNNTRINYIADENGNIKVPKNSINGKRARIFAGNIDEKGEIIYKESSRAILKYNQENLASEPKLGYLEEGLGKFNIADNAYWINGSSLERTIDGKIDGPAKTKFDRKAFVQSEKYDLFKEYYLNGKESLKEIAEKYGMSASSAGIIGKEEFGGLGRKSSRIINGIYS